MKKLRLIITILIIFALAVFCGCGSPDHTELDGIEFAEITGVKEINLKVGEGTDQKLLDGVSVVLLDGTTKTPTLKKDGFDANTAGKYTVSYEYGNVKKSTNVYVYAMPQIYFNGQEVVTDTLAISFGQANQSYDFTKGITVLDSFGKALDFEKSEDSDEFNKQEGEYSVQYTATDVVGNTLVKDVTFIVTVGSAPTATSGDYFFDINGLKVPCDLKGETSGLLYEGDDLVNPDNYYFDGENLVLTHDYCLASVGENNFTLETNEGFCSFEVEIIDDGKPIFQIKNLDDTVLAQGWTRSELPTDERANSTVNTYQYSLKNSNGEDFKVVPTDKRLNFYTLDDKALPVDTYTLTVQATANGMSSTMEYDFTVETLDGAVLKTRKFDVLETYEEDGTLITKVNYNGGEVQSTPFADAIWSAYLGAQEDGGKVLCFDIKFTGTASLNGHVIYGEENNNYYWSNTFRSNTGYLRFYNGNGAMVDYDQLTVDVWYTMKIDIDAIKKEYADMDTRDFNGYTGSSLRFGPNIEGETMYLKNASIVDKEPFAIKAGGSISAYYDGDTFVTVGSSNHQWYQRLFFSDSVWADYLSNQTVGDKVMSMDINFGDSVSLSGYLSGSDANLNTYRANPTFFRFYGTDGKMVAYENLQPNTWYRLDLDIDAIKTGIGEQSWANEGKETSISFAREESAPGTLAIKNLRFVDAYDTGLIFKSVNKDAITFSYDGDTLVTVGSSNHQWNQRLFFSDSVWADYITAQTAGGKLMSMDINFGDSVSLSGYLSGSSANLNTYRANPTFFRFYGADGKMVAYANLQANTWYRLDLDIDAIKTGIGEQSWKNEGKETSICFAREDSAPGTLSIKNLRFVDAYETGLIFKSAKKDAITFSYDGNDLITEVHYCGDTTATPFADSIFKEYLTAQTTGGMVLRYQVKFTGSATINGYINDTTLAGFSNPRANRAYFRYYDAQGNEVAYASLETGTWYTMVIDIDAIKTLGTVGENAVNGNITGCSLRFGANVSGEIISVKNAEFVLKANENPVA